MEGGEVKIEKLEIANFRGIKYVRMEDLKSTVVIAGANGSGKSCIFDAIRLLKSAYGGYQQNEWHHWMSEFQVNFTANPSAFLAFFQDKQKPMHIAATFRLHPNERAYLQAHGKELVRQSVWKIIAPELHGWSSYNAAPMAAQYRDREPEVERQTDVQWSAMLTELSQDTIEGRLFAQPNGDLQFSNSKALEILFSTFLPEKLGLLDYHGAQRNYSREQVSGVNLDLTAQNETRKQTALYNYNAKYSNVKGEMAGAYIKELLSEKAGADMSSRAPLDATLAELFSTFFPDKKFLGPQATASGALTFPVTTASGAKHDLDELSSGEKEILYGYLRIRNSAPRYSLILLDEPELHLNPRLIQSLPRFYHYHLGVNLDNQIWLVTHSDALLREVIGQPEYSVFHMSAANEGVGSQTQVLNVREDAESAVISLVGDIAAYRPGKKILIFEGGGDSEFDEYFTGQLFPELLDVVNIISSGNKLRVRELHEVLDRAASKGVLPFTVYSITDKDSESEISLSSGSRYTWDVYHIENYLLEPRFILQVLRDLNIKTFTDEAQVYDELRKSAKSNVLQLVRHALSKTANDKLVRSINTAIEPKSRDLPKSLRGAIERSTARIHDAESGDLSLQSITTMATELTTQLEQDLGTDAWRSSFMGREILKDFFGRHTQVGYSNIRHLIIARMRDAGFVPAGMATVIERIIKA
jgi:predicted ATPase